MMKKSKKGFTLVELVIVIAILAILAAVAIPTFAPLTSDAKANVDAVNAKTIESVVKLAAVEASKDSADNVTLDVQQVYNAVYEANLNIKDGSFTYTVNTGAVEPATPETAGTTTAYVIIFSSEDGALPLTVSDGVNDPAEDYVTNYVPEVTP